SIERDPLHVYSNPGQYAVRLQLEVPTCDPIFLAKSIDILGCRKTDEEYQFAQVYPNPSSGHFKVALNLPDDGDIAIQVYSANGRKERNTQKSVLKNEVVDIELNNSGFHIIEIKHIYGIQLFKVLIVK